MAAVTKSLSFGITASTSYEAPFALARRFSTLDHLTNGRVAWNVVTSYLESAAKNFGLQNQISHDERYAMADEFLEVAYKLWEGSWRDDAVVRDDVLKRYVHPDSVRRIDHEGRYYQVAGPHLVEPSRQRTPFIFQAGASKAGKLFATKHAKAMFLPGMEIVAVARLVKEIRRSALEQGRDPRSLKLLAGLHVVLGETDELASRKYEEYLSYADMEGSLALFGGWTGTDLAGIPDDADIKFVGPPAMQSMVENWSKTIPGSDTIKWTKARVAQELAFGGAHARAVGSSKTVADVLEKWVLETGVDGFNLSYAIVPGDLEDHAKLLVPELKAREVKWNRSPFYNATILGLCSFAAPGLWGAMNSLGAGGAQKPYLVNTGNSLTFCLMVISCWFTSGLVKYVGIKGALAIGTVGFPVYSAGLYLNNRYGVEWLVIFGAACCGISAGIFWATEAAIAIVYPEPRNRGRMVAYWLSYTRFGQILGGAINLGLNADRNEAGKVSYVVYLIFIVLQALGTFVALLLTHPSKVQRPSGTKVDMSIFDNPFKEFKATTRVFLRKEFLLLILWIGQAVFAEAIFFSYIALHFSVRARALGSFVSGIVAVIAGNLLGVWLDQNHIPLRKRARWAFLVIMALQGGWWTWMAVNVTEYNRTQEIYDWSDPGFGRAFGVFIFLVVGFQLNYNFAFFLIGQLSNSPQETIRLSALLRGTESAWQAISYGLSSIPIFAAIGGAYFNFALWAISIFPAWLVVKRIGATLKT
ncbi:related to DUF895 domain membrane protein [Cephalotrichum gorgonifer]|uniref:Related to DUF895 domain membrane protein n=1 Tax=Cephalotrichum gorgonifer TaxID=2041049 RepID=A0AAE8MZ09_9PEZI|nr:related to DUF895 domain membrane protein [Cephalotrichum gorgonifer]